MSRMTVSYFPPSLFRAAEFELLHPGDTPPMFRENNPCYQRPIKTLFLLHGYTGGKTDWMLNSPVQDLSAKYNLAVVCPAGENSFYLNQKGTGRAYGDCIGRDLPDYLRNTFGLELSPENTLIAGYSMGGFGAIHVGLSHPETFGHIIALSSALIVHEVAEMKPGSNNGMADYDYYAATFGEPKDVLASRNNPETLVKDLKAAGAAIPGIFMACGSEDFLIEPNRAFHRFLTEEGVPVTYHESPGVHDFVFWNQYIERGIRWALGLPEEK